MKTTEDRFWEKVDKRGEDECWNWAASCYKNGYPQFMFSGINSYGHRYSYLLHKGELLEGQWVGNTCSNRRCVNPGHLFLDTPRAVTLKPNSKSPSNLAFRSRTCVHGHVWDGDTVRFWNRARKNGTRPRVCRPCHLIRMKTAQLRRNTKDPDYNKKAYRKQRAAMSVEEKRELAAAKRAKLISQIGIDAYRERHRAYGRKSRLKAARQLDKP